MAEPWLTVLGALYALLTPLRSIWQWWTETRPARKVLGRGARQSELLRIFVRDLSIRPGTPLYSQDGVQGPIGVVPNVHMLWPDVEGRGVAYVVNALGAMGKTRGIDIVHMSADPGLWDSHLIVMGAQAQKSFDFYKQMDGVAFAMDAHQIWDTSTSEPVPMEGPGYGLILKARNPFVKGGRAGVAILIGGFGTLGTAAAGYYFRAHLADLGKRFGSSCFGVVVRASVSAGEQSAQRLPEYDRLVPG